MSEYLEVQIQTGKSQRQRRWEEGTPELKTAMERFIEYSHPRSFSLTQEDVVLIKMFLEQLISDSDLPMEAKLALEIQLAACLAIQLMAFIGQLSAFGIEVL